MSLRGSRCSKHPSQLVVGVCASCLRERLAVLVNVEGIGEANSCRSSPRHSIASEPIRNGYVGADAVRDRVFSARKPFDIGIDGIKSRTVSVGRSISLHDSRNTGTSTSDNVFLGSRASDVSPIHGIKKKTLSSLFNLDDSDTPASKARIDGNCDRKVNAAIVNGFKRDDCFNGSSSSLQNKLQAKSRENEQEKSRRGSFSERAETSSSLYSVPEDDRPLSWFSSLFRRRKKESRPKSIDAFATFGEHNGWEDARRSWEAPRPSSWEKLRFSSWEVPRPSWEPARPSWEGLMQTPDGESVFSGFDFFNDSLSEVREDTELECTGLQDFVSYMAGDWGNSSGATRGPRERRKIEEGNAKQVVLKIGEGNASETKQMVLKTPPSDERERARTFVSAKAMQLQRDVSTQTTPPRASSVATDEKAFIQQRQPHHQPQHHHQQPRAPAAWSKVFSKTFSNPRWAFKHKSKDEFKDQEAMIIGEADDRASTVSGSSFHESARESTTHRHSQGKSGMNKEHGAWNAYCSPVQKSDLKVQQQQHKKFVQDGDSTGDRSRRSSSFSPFSLENGLLRFYLTPVRSTLGSRAKSKQKGYGPWL